MTCTKPSFPSAGSDGGDDDDDKKKEEDDPLARTGRLFGGAIKDVKRRYKHYLSDFKDGLNMQVTHHHLHTAATNIT